MKRKLVFSFVILSSVILSSCGKKTTIEAVNPDNPTPAEIKTADFPYIKDNIETDNNSNINDNNFSDSLSNNDISENDSDYFDNTENYFTVNNIPYLKEIPDSIDYTWMQYMSDGSDYALSNGKWSLIDAHREKALEDGFDNIILVCQYSNETGITDDFEYISYWDTVYDLYTGAEIPGVGTYNNDIYTTDISINDVDNYEKDISENDCESFQLTNSNSVLWDTTNYKIAIRSYVFRVPSNYNGIVLNLSSYNSSNLDERIKKWTGYCPSDYDENHNLIINEEENNEENDEEYISENDVSENDVVYAQYEEGDCYILINPQIEEETNNDTNINNETTDDKITNDDN